jgi:glucans biosynthesis protein
MHLGRREFILGTGAASLATASLTTASLAIASLATAVQAKTRPFSFETVIDLARRSANQPYSPPDTKLSPQLAGLSYDAYRRIQFLHPQALWANDGLEFRVEFFHRGGLYSPKIDLFEVIGGQATPLTYRPEQFLYDPPLAEPLPADTGFAGFRIISRNGVDLDEIATFLGASYFRALGRGQQYGQSARGLALGTGNPKGEEFPYFRSFWIERPATGETVIRVHALLDSQSVTGAFSFKITPGTATVFDVRSALFPRVTLTEVGIAPLTSMYLFGPANPGRFDDFRAAVHDSDGLQIKTGAGEPIWRQLENPTHVEESAFADRNPAGFGLMQRETSLDAYDDDEARYQLRPSAWVSPTDGWGKGSVHLFELPTREETADNIVAFWRPDAPLRPGQRYDYHYNITWGGPNINSPQEGKVVKTRTGRALNTPDARQFIVDFVIPATESAQLTAKLTTSTGVAGPVRLQALDTPGHVRASFLFTPPTNAQNADLRLVLFQDDRAVTETWIFRWTT